MQYLFIAKKHLLTAASFALILFVAPLWDEFLEAADIGYYETTNNPRIDEDTLSITMPIVAIDSVFGVEYYSVEMELVSSFINFDFEVVSVEIVEGYDSPFLPFYTSSNSTLTIPEVEYAGILYSMEFEVIQSTPSVLFRLSSYSQAVSE